MTNWLIGVGGGEVDVLLRCLSGAAGGSRRQRRTQSESRPLPYRRRGRQQRPRRLTPCPARCGAWRRATRCRDGGRRTPWCRPRAHRLRASDGQLRLAAFVWGDQPDRLARLRAAIEVARRVPAELRAGDAIDTVRQLTPVDGTWTVLWQSVFRQYLTDDQIGELTRAVAAVGETATATARFAHLTLEPDRASTANAFPVSLTTWPNGQQRLLGTAPGHGLPVTWR